MDLLTYIQKRIELHKEEIDEAEQKEKKYSKRRNENDSKEILMNNAMEVMKIKDKILYHKGALDELSDFYLNTLKTSELSNLTKDNK